MTQQSDFTADEWQLITDGPEWVLAAMQATDGRQGRVAQLREFNVFKRTVYEYETKSELVKAVSQDKTRSEGRIAKADAAEAMGALQQINAILAKKADRSEADDYRDFLVDVAKAVSEAVSEGLLGLGAKVSKAETAAIESIMQALKATPADKKARMDAEVAAMKAEAAKQKAAEEANAKQKEIKDAELSEAQREAARAKIRAAAQEASAGAAAAEAAAAEAEAQQAAEERSKQAEKNRAEAAAKIEAARERLEEKEREKEAAAAAEAAKSPYIEEYTVVSGDNLSAISRKYYGDPNQWKKIYEANKDVIGANPNLIRPGQVFKIPKL